MAVQYKVLGQTAPAANSLSTLYAVGSQRMAVGSTLNVCNRSLTDSLRYTIEVSPDGSPSANAHKQFASILLSAGATDSLTLGWALQAGAVVRVSADTGNASFTLFGQELTP